MMALIIVPNGPAWPPPAGRRAGLPPAFPATGRRPCHRFAAATRLRSMMVGKRNWCGLRSRLQAGGPAMARAKLKPLAACPCFVDIVVRTTDLNYAGHLGNDRLLSLVR